MIQQSSFIKSTIGREIDFAAYGLLAALSAFAVQEGSEDGFVVAHRLPMVEDFDSIIGRLVESGDVEVITNRAGTVLGYQVSDDEDRRLSDALSLAEQPVTVDDSPEVDEEVLIPSAHCQKLMNELEVEFAEDDTESDSGFLSDVEEDDEESDADDDTVEDSEDDDAVDEEVTVLDITVGDSGDESDDDDDDDTDDDVEEGFRKFMDLYPGGVIDSHRNFTAFEEAVGRGVKIDSILDDAEEYADRVSGRSRAPMSAEAWLDRR
jgi:hypothetical protein